jgi:hypothetical protein
VIYIKKYNKISIKSFVRCKINKNENYICLFVDESGMASEDAGPDENYCSSCGEIIKSKAEICPECGVRQGDSGQNVDEQIDDFLDGGIQDKRLAQKSIRSVMLWSFFITPVGYLKVGKTGLAIINFVTLNYFLLGPLVVPFHTRKMIKDARKRVQQS